MSRYIDADAIKDKAWKAESEACFYALEDVVSVTDIDTAPTIDIVRCRECKYAEVSVSPITGLWCTRFEINDMAMEDDDFCSYGERKVSEKPNSSKERSE